MLSEEDRRMMKDRAESEAEPPSPQLQEESCCPLRTVASERYPHTAGIYVLYGKYPHKKNRLCTDNCVYVRVRELSLVTKTTFLTIAG